MRKLIKLFFHYLVTNPNYLASYIFFVCKRTISPRRVFKTGFGFSINLDLRRGVDSEIYFNRFEPYLVQFYNKYLKETSVFMDIGSNIGFFSLLAANKIKSGKIYSVDADPLMTEEVKNNVVLNSFKNIEPINVGVSNTKGFMDFYVASDPAFSSFSKPHAGYQIVIKEVKNIPIDSIDNIANTHQIEHVDFIKMDIEGNELFAIQGATDLITKTKPTFSIEICDPNFKQFNYSSKELFDYMKKIGYCIYNFTSGSLQKEEIKEFYEYENFIFIHTDKLAEFGLE